MNRIFWKMFLLLIVALGLLPSCGGGGGDSAKEEPELSTSQTVLQFESTKGSQQSFSVYSNVDWTVVGCPDWLSLSSMSGSSGTTSITATTTVSNEESVDVQGTIQIRYGSYYYEIKVVQASTSPGIYADLVDENLRIALTYGFSCRIGFGPNTTQAYWKVYTEEEYRGTSESTLEQQHRNWTFIRLEKESNTTVDSSGKTYSTKIGAMHSDGGDIYYMDLSYFQCKPNTAYKLVIYPYGNTTSKQGKKTVLDFTTLGTDQPVAKILPESFTINQEDQKFEWKIEQNTSCGKYYTYVCKSSGVFTSYTLANNLSSDVDRRGIIMALYMKMEKLQNQTGKHSFDAANKGCSGCTEYFLSPNINSGIQSVEMGSSDKYIEIITWGEDANGNPSGLFSDEIFDLTNMGSAYALSTNVTSLSFVADGESKTLNISGNDNWTCSTNQSWCTVSKTSGTGAASITVSAGQNTSTSSRTATITIKGTHTGKSITVSISQDGKAGNTENVTISKDDYNNDIPLDGTVITKDDYDNDKQL